MHEYETITSPSNPRVRAAAALRNAADRRASGLTLVDGLREIARAIEGKHAIEQVFFDDQPAAIAGDSTGSSGSDPRSSGRDRPIASILSAARDHGAMITRLSPRAFAKVAFGDRHEGLVAVVRFRGRALADGHLDRHARVHPPDASGPSQASTAPILIVEGIEKPGNLGAILRTADAAGIRAVIAVGGGTDPANPAVIRASLGTVFVVPLAVATTEEAVAWCGRTRLPVVAAMPHAGRIWYEADLGRTVAIVLGSEAHGLSPEWELASARGLFNLEPVALPMLGGADSLNVAATAAVLSYEALRQRSGQPNSRNDAIRPA